MRFTGEVTEDEVIAEFLKGEFKSDRWNRGLRALLDEHGVSDDVLARPVLTDWEQNNARRRLLDEHRGFVRREGLFDGFPDDVVWQRATLEPDEVLAVLYINWDWWLTVSGGTRRPREAARRIRRDEFAGVTAEEHEPLAVALLDDPPPPPLIAATTPAHAPLVLVEGHFRLTAYALFPQHLPPELEILLGISAGMREWSEF